MDICVYSEIYTFLRLLLIFFKNRQRYTTINKFEMKNNEKNKITLIIEICFT